ncbi:MAG TPA: hypothetical protein DDY37_07825 [Legionella sp.]|nr:hypothetical protein [Legionella sp.]
MKKTGRIMLLLMGTANGVFAADESASKQIQMLNSQIQSQLQQMQETQKKQNADLNTQIQAQLKKLQTDIQKKMNEGHAKTQDQIKTVQDNLQSQIKQVSEDITKIAASK